jgi:hypothetical protein
MPCLSTCKQSGPVCCAICVAVNRCAYAEKPLQVRRNLHIVLSFSPVGDAFRERLRKFPSLVNCTTLDWFTAWPRDALATVATNFLAGLPGADDKVIHTDTYCCDISLLGDTKADPHIRVCGTVQHMPAVPCTASIVRGCIC